MADTKISALATDSSPTPSDYVMTVDVSDTSMASTGTNKKALVSTLPFAGAAAAVPIGGTTGQVLAKTSGTDYATAWTTPSGGSGSGTVTTVSVATANGVSGAVANPTTTPTLTLSLGAITPASVASVGAVTGSNLSGTNTGDQTNITGNAATVTTNANLTGPVTSVGNATTIVSGAVTNAMLAGSIAASKLVETDLVLTESQVTGLTTDLAAKAPLASPAFTGTVTLPVGLTGLAKLTSGVVSAAVAGTDYQAAGSYSPLAGSTSLVTVGMIATGTWQGTAIADTYIASAAIWNAKAPTASPNFTGSVTAPVRVATPHADTDGSTITFDFSLSDFHAVTLAGNRTLVFSGATAGQVVRIELIQDATGGRTVTWPTVRWASGTTPTLASTAAKADQFAIVVRSDGTFAGALSIPNY